MLACALAWGGPASGQAGDDVRAARAAAAAAGEGMDAADYLKESADLLREAASWNEPGGDARPRKPAEAPKEEAPPSAPASPFDIPDSEPTRTPTSLLPPPGTDSVMDTVFRPAPGSVEEMLMAFGLLLKPPPIPPKELIKRNPFAISPRKRPKKPPILSVDNDAAKKITAQFQLTATFEGSYRGQRVRYAMINGTPFQETETIAPGIHLYKVLNGRALLSTDVGLVPLDVTPESIIPPWFQADDVEPEEMPQR